MDLTANEQEVVRLAIAAQELLDSETLQLVVKQITIDAFTGFTESYPGETRKREDLYNLHRGLQAIEAQLRAYVQAKDEIERKLNAFHDNDDSE